MDCYLCDQEAAKRCSRCGNPYCGDHGEDPSLGSGQALCADCLSPVSAAPSGAVFRASLLALLLGSVLALWLLIRPPGLPGDSSGALIPSGSPLPTAAITPTPVASPVTQTPAADTTPQPTPTATPTPEPEGPIEYTVVEGDTWFGIAEAFRDTIPGDTLEEDAEALAAANGLTLDDFLPLGPGLVIPQ